MNSSPQIVSGSIAFAATNMNHPLATAGSQCSLESAPYAQSSVSQMKLEQTPMINENHDSAKKYRPTSMLENLSKPRVTVSQAPLQVFNVTVKPRLDRYLVR